MSGVPAPASIRLFEPLSPTKQDTNTQDHNHRSKLLRRHRQVDGVAVRVFHVRDPLAPGHVVRRSGRLAAQRLHSREGGVDVGHLQAQQDPPGRGALDRPCWPAGCPRHAGHLGGRDAAGRRPWLATGGGAPGSGGARASRRRPVGMAFGRPARPASPWGVAPMVLGRPRVERPGRAQRCHVTEVGAAESGSTAASTRLSPP